MASNNNIGVGDVLNNMNLGNFGGLPDVDFDFPDVFGDFTMPDMPSFDFGGFEMPNLEMPDFGGFQMPDMGGMQMPDMPDTNMEMPDVDAGGLCDELGGCLGDLFGELGNICSAFK